MPKEILQLPIETFNITSSYFSSPITYPTQLHQCYYPHPRNLIFYSKGQAFSHKWQNIEIAYPHGIETTQKAIHRAKLATQENSNTITILITPNKEWYTNYTPYENRYKDTHIITHFPPDTIQYYEPTIPIELNKKPRNESLAIKILCIHHKTTPIHTKNLAPKMR
jgi:hypothetical protein